MGIKQTITKDELPLKYQSYNLIETTDGVSHSVYLLGDKYVVKIVETHELKTLLNEQNLLEKLSSLLVPELLDIVKKDNHILAFYTQIEGESVSIPTVSQIKQIALFLKKFHTLSKDIKSSNENIFDKDYLKKLISKTNNQQFHNYFNSIKCEPKHDGVIHGDLFCDNAKFANDTLSGVYDFTEASIGDFRYELGVVASSWCFENDILNDVKVEVLLESYEMDIDISDFKEYIKYALLYFAVVRYIGNRDYKELLVKLERL